jgi:hypothetical protein
MPYASSSYAVIESIPEDLQRLNFPEEILNFIKYGFLQQFLSSMHVELDVNKFQRFSEVY